MLRVISRTGSPTLNNQNRKDAVNNEHTIGTGEV